MNNDIIIVSMACKMYTYNFAESAHSKCFGLVSLLATLLLMKVSTILDFWVSFSR